MTWFSKLVPGRRRLGYMPLSPYHVHRQLWDLFPDGPAAPRDFLFREAWGSDRPTVYLLSERMPEPGNAAWQIVGTRPYRPLLREGQRLQFSLRANPTRAIKSADGRRQRVDVVMHSKKLAQARAEGDEIPRTTPGRVQEAATAWLLEREQQLGCRIAPETVRADSYRQHAIRRKGQTITFSSVDLTGLMTVRDPERVVASAKRGVGRAKAFGCGLLLLRPVR